MNFNPVLKTKSRGIKIAVVGSGPSGLSCAAELCKDGFEVDIFERKPQPGGMLRYLIPDYRLGKDFLDKELNDITSLGVNIKCNSSIKSEDDLKNLFEEGYKRIYIATGTWQVESLGLGSDIKGFLNAVEFLEKCKSSEKDEMVKILEDRAVFVIGGGDTALDTARTALKFGAGEVSIIYRRSFMQMPGNEKEKIAALKSGIHFLILTQPVKYLSGEGKITGIEVVRNKLGDIDPSGRPRPIPVDNSNHTIDADIIIEAIGLKPDISNKELFSKLQLSEKGLIIVDDKTGSTSRKNIHAGGDIIRGPSLIVEAVADGKRAARAIAKSMELS
ncbi:Glutamate synthase [NADPH] small chain [subsurface metagenome]